jgi:arginase
VSVHLILVPYDSGVRGWRMGAGPERLVEAGLADALRQAGHDVTLEVVTVDGHAGRTETQTAFALLHAIAAQVRGAVTAGRFPLVVAGNCLSAVGVLAGLARASRTVVWFDAHGDLNTPDTTVTGFLDGMALATAQGLCWQQLARAVPGFAPVEPSACCLVGVRDLDPAEAQLIAAMGITHAAPAALTADLDRFLRRPERGDGGAYVHFDLDVLDPAVGQANPFPVPGGLSVAAATAAIGAISRVTGVAAAALTAYAPEYDTGGTVPTAACAIARALVEAARSASGGVLGALLEDRREDR